MFERTKRAYEAFKGNGEKSASMEEWQKLADFLGLDSKMKTESRSEATYFACQKVLMENMGKLPCKLMQKKSDSGVETLRDNSLYRIVAERPNPYMTATGFWSTVEYNRNHYGNAYVLITGAGSKTQLWLLPFESVTVVYDNAKRLDKVPDIYYVYTCGEGTYTFSSEEILHFRTSNTLNGILGVSVQDQLKMTIDSNIKGQDVINNLYDNGFTAKAVLQYTGNLSDPLVQKFTQGIENYAKGKMKENGISNIIPIPIGATLTPLNMKLSEAQYIEIRKYTSMQIASAFGIKPYQIGDYGKESYASQSAQQLSFYIDTLLYILKQYEEELNYKLLTDKQFESGMYFKFNVSTILRADLKTQIETLSQGVSNFIYTPNEARSYLDLPAKEGGDKLLGNGASIPVELTGTQYVNSANSGGGE